MSAKTWHFTVQGTVSDGRSWIAEGTIICEFANAFGFVMRQVMDQLSDGRCLGTPCNGPYNVQRVLIVQRS